KAAFEVEELTGGHQFNRFGFSHHSYQSLSSSRTRKHSQCDFLKPHFPRAFTRNTKIGGQRNLQSTTDAMPVDRCDDELRCLFQPRQRLIGMKTKIILKSRGHVSE